jgi:DNA recombination protein RmuC
MALQLNSIVLMSVLLVVAAVAWSRMREMRSRVNEYRSERDALRLELADERFAHRALIEEHAHLQATLDAERDHAQDIQRYIQVSRAELGEAFAAASAQALEQNSDRFMQIAASTFQHQQALGISDHEKRVDQMSQMLRPLQESLGNVDRQFSKIELERVGSYEALRTQVDALHKTTSALSTALKAPKTRGRWGELHLRRVVELAGMQEKVDFSTEVSTDSADGRRRPDMIVHMPNGGSVVVDAKTPLDSFSRALEHEDGPERESLLLDHARRIRQHVKELSAKQYHEQFTDAPEFVVLFIPGEAVFAAAVDVDPDLLDFAFRRRVHIASPVTFISILRGVAQGWHQKELADSAQTVVRLGKDLHDRIFKLTEHWGTLAKHLSSAVGAYNDSVRSMETRLLPTARRLAEIHSEEGTSSVQLASPIMNSASTTVFSASVQPIP